MINRYNTSQFFSNKWHTFFWSILLLSPILGWLSVLILGLLGLSQLRFKRQFTESFNSKPMRIAGFIILLYLMMLFTFGRVYEFGWKAIKFPAGLLVPLCLFIWFNKRKISEDFLTRSAVYAVIVISLLMGAQWLYYKVTTGIYVRVEGLSANPLFVSAMLLPLQLLAIHNFQHAARDFKKTIIISWLLGLICLAVFLGARSSFMIMLVLSFASFLWQMEGKRKKLNFISITLVFTGLLVTLLYLFSDKLDFIRRMKMLLDFVITFDVHNMTDVSMKTRLDTWQAAWHAIMKCSHGQVTALLKSSNYLGRYLPQWRIRAAYLPPRIFKLYTWRRYFWLGLRAAIFTFPFIRYEY